MKVRKTTEDYLKTIYVISQQEDVHACMIAERLGVTRPTVSVYLKRLAEEEYLTIDSHNVITLTEKGLQTARSVFDRHQVLQKFLMNIGVSEKAAFRDACEMEHVLCEESLAAIKHFVDTHNLEEQKTCE